MIFGGLRYMPYVVVKAEHAKFLNEAIMRLLVPSHLREDDWTDLYCPMIKHPQLGYIALILPDVEKVPLHIEADGLELQQIMSIFVNDGAITQEEAGFIVGAVRSYAGQTVKIADFLPPSWSGNVFTEEQMIQGGWFNTSGQLEV